MYHPFKNFAEGGDNCTCPLLKLTERLGLSTQNDPRKQRKIANSFVLRVEALLSGVVLGGQTQSPREFQEWTIGL